MTPKKFNKTLTAFSVLAGLILLIGVFYSWKNIQKLSRNVYEKEVYLNNFTNKVSTLNSLKINYEKNLVNLDKILYSLPVEKKADIFMVDLESIAMQTGVKLTVYKYFPSSGKGKKKAEVPSDLNLTQSVKQKDYYEVPLNINVEGTHLNVFNFMKKMEGLRRSHNVKNLQIIKLKREDIPPDYIQLISDVSIYFKE